MNYDDFKIWLQTRDREDLLSALEKILVNELPLKSLAQHSGLFDQESLQFGLLTTDFADDQATAVISLFYQEISNPCPCSGDVAEKADGYCELLLRVNVQNHTAELNLR